MEDLVPLLESIDRLQVEGQNTAEALRGARRALHEKGLAVSAASQKRRESLLRLQALQLESWRWRGSAQCLAEIVDAARVVADAIEAVPFSSLDQSLHSTTHDSALASLVKEDGLHEEGGLHPRWHHEGPASIIPVIHKMLSPPAHQVRNGVLAVVDTSVELRAAVRQRLLCEVQKSACRPEMTATPTTITTNITASPVSKKRESLPLSAAWRIALDLTGLSSDWLLEDISSANYCGEQGFMLPSSSRRHCDELLRTSENSTAKKRDRVLCLGMGETASEKYIVLEEALFKMCKRPF